MKLTSINIGRKKTQPNGPRLETTGIYKDSVEGPVQIGALGIEGDFIASKRHHGGPDQAVYVYGGADYAWWSQDLGKEIVPGTFGDNLTISELESAKFNIGDTLHIGEVTLQVTSPRIPCSTFARRMGDPQFIRKFRNAERPGLYCRVIREGSIETGNEVKVEAYMGETVSTLLMFRDFFRRDKKEATLRHFLKAPIAIRARIDIERDLQKIITRNSVL
jgi:MOSC domain-containing protein YiiM